MIRVKNYSLVEFWKWVGSKSAMGGLQMGHDQAGRWAMAGLQVGHGVGRWWAMAGLQVGCKLSMRGFIVTKAHFIRVNNGLAASGS